MTGEEKDFDPEGLSAEEIAILEGGEDGLQDGEQETQTEAEAVTVSDEQKPETEAQEGAETGEDKPNPAERAPDGYVPIGALQEARAELKEFKAWQRQIAEKLAERREQPKEEKPEEQVPGWDDDPFARMQHVEKRLDEFQNASKQQTEEQQKAQAEFEQAMQIVQQADTKLVEEFNNDPQLETAFNHAREKIIGSLQAQGYYGPKLNQAVQQQTINLSKAALGWPGGVADYVRRVAAFHGWSPQAANPDPNPGEAAEKVARIADAVDKNKTLKGGGSKGELTLEDLAQMDGEELEKLIGKDDELFARLAG